MTSSTPVLATLATLLAFTACHRKVEEQPEPELIEHRIEPCHAFCDAMYDPECGADPLPPRSVDACFEACATLGHGSQWAPQPDGTDACATEWMAHLDCALALDCEDRRLAFSGGDHRPCWEEAIAKADCFFSTPNLDREDPPR